MSKSPAFAFIFLLVSAIFAAAQDKADFDIAGDPAPSEHWFDPDKLRQEALAARPDYLAALDQICQLSFVTDAELLQ